ncbi:chromosome replication/partitioning protein [Borrelia hermsii]|uniref:PF49-type protein n=1 Tax=Borrelia hermsii HS1 TaxID=1867252 RepID=A0ABM6AR71_BORHE|nr:chromosome replication/partitioning protein [Borrelia hermsii]ANA43827.1 PF49-type protein [Borrelia hermsii HS1]
MKNNKELKINKRNIDSKGNALLTASDDNEEGAGTVRYNALKKKLYINLREGIFHKIDSIRILKEIKDNEYYKLKGYKSFDSFIKSYDVAKTQAYNYLKIATALEEGLLEEQYVLENGFRQILSLLKDKESATIKKSKVNLIKPLRFRLKSQESYAFYKKNAKLTSFLMDELFENQKDLLDKLLKKYKELKGE